MDAKAKSRCKVRARIMKALAHPTRLFIIEELLHGEKCVCELADKVGADMSTISKHLAILKGAGLVQDEKRSVQVFYQLKTPCIIEFLNCVESVIESNAREQLDLITCRRS